MLRLPRGQEKTSGCTPEADGPQNPINPKPGAASDLICETVSITCSRPARLVLVARQVRPRTPPTWAAEQDAPAFPRFALKNAIALAVGPCNAITWKCPTLARFRYLLRCRGVFSSGAEGSGLGKTLLVFNSYGTIKVYWGAWVPYNSHLLRCCVF